MCFVYFYFRRARIYPYDPCLIRYFLFDLCLVHFLHLNYGKKNWQFIHTLLCIFNYIFYSKISKILILIFEIFGTRLIHFDNLTLGLFSFSIFDTRLASSRLDWFPFGFFPFWRWIVPHLVFQQLNQYAFGIFDIQMIYFWHF